MAIGILGTGFHVPAKVMTNNDFAKLVDTSDEWIREKVGIVERRVAAQHEATSDLAIYAALEAFRNANDCHCDPILNCVRHSELPPGTIDLQTT